MSDTAALLERLREAGAELTVQGDGQLLCTAPKDRVPRELVGDLRVRKAEVLELLATEAVVNYRRLREQVTALGDAADALEAAGDVGRAGELESEAIALMEGAAGEAVMRMMGFPEELVTRAEATLDQVHEEAEPAEGDRPWRCRNCGGTAYWERKDGLLMCAVCRPSPEMCEQLPPGIPADGRGQLGLKVLEEGNGK